MPGGHSTVEPPVPIPNTEVKCSNADGSATYVCVRVGYCQASPFIFLYADMAQLVERTLGKGEVPSSILGISTIQYTLNFVTVTADCIFCNDIFIFLSF